MNINIKATEQIAVKDLRKNLNEIIEQEKSFFITKRGKPVKAIIPYEDFLEILEMFDEVRDVNLIREIALGREEYKKTGGVTANNLRKKLSL